MYKEKDFAKFRIFDSDSNNCLTVVFQYLTLHCCANSIDRPTCKDHFVVACLPITLALACLIQVPDVFLGTQLLFSETF